MDKDFNNVYFAGALFTIKDLLGNSILSEEIFSVSNGKYRCVLPQNFEQRKLQPKKIRDEDILTLLQCDVAIFNFDGTELDSGTVVEFMFAKFADIPTVILRSDFRGAGDCLGADTHESFPWNLMASYYPRTRVVQANAAALYKECIAKYYFSENSRYSSSNSGSEIGRLAAEKMAHSVVEALNEAVAEDSVMPKEIRQAVYQWLEKMPNFSDTGASERIKAALSRKISKKIL